MSKPPPLPHYAMTNDLSFDFFSDYTPPQPQPSKSTTNPNPKSKSTLTRWDRASRSWLSSGTFMLLFLLLLHALQFRSDLRNFTSTADAQLCSACSVLENKVSALQGSLDAAAQSIAPVNVKFTVDLKDKIRRAFHFGAQIFAGRIRETVLSAIKAYYCAFLGILVVFQSLLGSIKMVFFEDSNFMASALECIKSALDRAVGYMKDPEKFITKLLMRFYDQILPDWDYYLKIPVIRMAAVEICQNLRGLDFSQIHLALRRYLILVISMLTMILILYKTLVFVDECSDDEDTKETKEAKERASHEHRLLFLFKPWLPFQCLCRLVNWCLHFLSYQPFWIFLAMGIIGALHLHFTNHLILQAKLIKSRQIDPRIDEITASFGAFLSTAVTDLDRQWNGLFSQLLGPIQKFIETLAGLVKPVLQSAATVGKSVFDYMHRAVDYIKNISLLDALAEGVFVFLDCMVLRFLRKYIRIGEKILDRLLLSDGWRSLLPSVLGLLQGALTALFEELGRTGAVKRMFSAGILVFLRMVRGRSAFLWVYLGACGVFLMQALVMAVINEIFA